MQCKFKFIFWNQVLLLFWILNTITLVALLYSMGGGITLALSNIFLLAIQHSQHSQNYWHSKTYAFVTIEAITAICDRFLILLSDRFYLKLSNSFLVWKIGKFLITHLSTTSFLDKPTKKYEIFATQSQS